IAGRPPREPEDFIMAAYRAVSPAYFETMAIPLRNGRLLDPRDVGEPTVVIVNEAMVRTYFGGRNPIGQRLQLGALPEKDEPYLDIVGVVGDVKQSFETGAKAEMYVPYLQHPDTFFM